MRLSPFWCRDVAAAHDRLAMPLAGHVHMRRVLPVAMTVMTLACQTVGHSSAADGTERDGRSEQLSRLQHHWADAYARRDTMEIGRLLADEFTDIGDEGVLTKAPYLAQAAGLRPALDPLVLRDETFRFYGDAAVSTGRLRGQSDAPASAAYFMAVYVWRDGRWQAVAFQLSSPRP